METQVKTIGHLYNNDKTVAYHISMDSVSNLTDKFKEVDRMLDMFEKRRKKYVWRKRGRRR